MIQHHSGLFKAAAGSDVVPFLAGSEQSTGCLLKLGSLQRQRASLFNIPQRQLCRSYVCCWKAEERDEQSHLFLRVKHSNCCSVETEKLWINSQKLHRTAGFWFVEGFLNLIIFRKPFNQQPEWILQHFAASSCLVRCDKLSLFTHSFLSF